jgi:Anticodon-binding domain
LKACSEASWQGESILVLHQILVDPPYGAENCKIVKRGAKESLDNDSLERVKKIVLMAQTNSNKAS